MLKMIGLWTQGMRKCVPSPTTAGRTPRKRSNITALSPPSTNIGRKKGGREEEERKGGRKGGREGGREGGGREEGRKEERGQGKEKGERGEGGEIK